MLMRTSRGRPDPELVVVAVVLAWIGGFLLADAVPLSALGISEPAREIVLGGATWAMLGFLLSREQPIVRVQTLLVVVFASIVEYTFSPLLEAYVYRIGTVPLFVPPGHGLVYLGALALSRSRLVQSREKFFVTLTVAAGGAWALYGLTLADRKDVLGAFWYLCLIGFLIWGRARLLYVGAFAVVTYLELLGTHLHTWAWSPYDPVLGVISQGNPPSGAAGGYGWFDLYATLLAPKIYGLVRRPRASAWRRPFVATALPPNGPSLPSSEVNTPPASTTIGTSAAMSYSISSGSQAMSTAPSASSMYDQKSP